MAAQPTMKNFCGKVCEFSIAAIDSFGDIGEYFEVCVSTIYLFDEEPYICWNEIKEEWW